MTADAGHLTIDELEAGLDEIRRSPKDEGVVELLVRRPREDEREVLPEAELDVAVGLVGDDWKTRGSPSTPDGSARPDTQITIMNSRVIALVAQAKDRWPLAGDQLFIDLDLGDDNLPPGTRLAIGSAVLEIMARPHTGCQKFAERFGVDAQRLVNSPLGRQLQLRGRNTKVVQPGVVRVGDVAKRL